MSNSATSLTRKGRGRHRAFTLIELLVVVSIIALLVSILMPALSKAREQARRAVCGAHLHQCGIALFSYSGDNNGSVPMAIGDLGQWLWDVHMGTLDLFFDTGMALDALYCPSTPQLTKDTVFAGGGRQASEWNAPYYGMIGYYWLGQRVQDPEGLGAGFDFPKLADGREYIKRVDVKRASEKEIMTDATYSDAASGVLDPYFYVNTFWTADWKPNHMFRSEVPDGTNVLFLDGRVYWRQWPEMEVGVIGFPGLNLPHHWW